MNVIRVHYESVLTNGEKAGVNNFKCQILLPLLQVHVKKRSGWERVNGMICIGALSVI